MIDSHINRMLVLGNGFDLYHRLPTKYTDFILVLRELSTNGGKINCSNFVNMLLNDDQKAYFDINDEDYIGETLEFSDFSSKNFWVEYFVSKYRDVDLTWIDLENDISSYLKDLKSIFNEYNEFLKRFKMDRELNVFYLIQIDLCDVVSMHYDYSICTNYTEEYIESIEHVLENFDSDLIQEKNHENEFNAEFSYFKKKLMIDVMLFWYKNDKTIRNYREICLDEIYQLLLLELQNFSLVLKEYLSIIDDLADVLTINSDFLNKRIEFDSIISFNYTTTYRLYKNLTKAASVSHIHGDLESEIILGLADDSDAPVYFKKEYLKSLNGLFNLELIEAYEIFDIHIFGHSLDISDHKFFKELFMLNKKSSFAYYNIYYRNMEQKAQLLNNIITIVGLEYFTALSKENKINFELVENNI